MPPADMFDSLRRIIQAVNAAPDLNTALNLIVQRVKQTIGADVASVYFRDADGQLVLMATDGLNPAAVGMVRLDEGEGLVGLVVERAEPVNLEDGPQHHRYRYVTETEEEPFHGFLGVPIIQHRRVLGALVVRQRAVRRFAETEETFLVTLAAQLAGAISHADASGGVNRLLQEVGGTAFTLKGLSGSPGLSLGRALVVYPPANLDAIPDHALPSRQVEAEQARFRQALAEVEADLRALSERMSASLPAEDLALFDALQLMLSSDTLIEPALRRIREGNWAPGALRETIRDHVKIFDAMEDAYLRERGEDVRDLGRRILMRLQSDQPTVREVAEPTILVGEEVSVSHLADVPPEYLAGIVSAKGSSSSHVAILAHALGIPAVMGVEELPVNRLDEQNLVIDGYRGQVYVRPTGHMLEEFERLVSEEAELAAGLEELASLPALTPDGLHVPLYVNTGLLSDISPSLRSGADGVGLYRTEIPFLIRDGFPGEEEQMQIYRQVLEGFAPRPVTLRTLDIGGDKPLPYFPIHEDNPFLGWRGIRLMLDHPEIFLTQLRAVLRASQGLHNLRLMLPMISDVGEVDEALALIRRAHGELAEEGMEVDLPQVGVMIEVPSAIYQIPQLAKRVDFFSVGTNDLTQYLLAVDRNNASVAKLYDSLHPAVLQALGQIVDQAHARGREVSVCGEMAGDPGAALILLGLGVDSLSMSVGSIARVKAVIRAFSLARARELVSTALGMEKAIAVRSLLSSALEEAGLGGLVRAGK